MKKKILKLLYILGIILWSITLLYSIISIFMGINPCILNFKAITCDKIYGFRAMGQVWHIMLYQFYLVYLGSMLIMIHQSKKQKPKKLLLYSITPILISILIFIAAILSKTSSAHSMFVHIYRQNIWIILSIIIGIINILRITFQTKKTS